MSCGVSDGQMTRKLRARTARCANQALLVPPGPRISNTASPSPCCSTSTVFPMSFIRQLPSHYAATPCSNREMAELGLNQIGGRQPQVVNDVEMVAAFFQSHLQRIA
jgi:hypothetical protein